VFFVSGSEVSTCLSYVFELPIFEFHLVYAAPVVCLCGVILWLQVVLNCVFSSVPSQLQFNVTSTGNVERFKKLYNGIPNVTVWRVLRKRLHLKAYELSMFKILKDE
jgi:hypothetical protein